MPLWKPTDSQSERDRREKRGYMKTVHTLTALNYRADYSGRMALDSSGSQADTALQKPDFYANTNDNNDCLS